MVLVAVLSDTVLNLSRAAQNCTTGATASAGTGSSRITLVRSKTDVEAQGATVATTPRRNEGPFRHPAGCGW